MSSAQEKASVKNQLLAKSFSCRGSDVIQNPLCVNKTVAEMTNTSKGFTLGKLRRAVAVLMASPQS
jgi:hypothetical protein